MKINNYFLLVFLHLAKFSVMLAGMTLVILVKKQHKKSVSNRKKLK